jgi:hypothetical protein
MRRTRMLALTMAFLGAFALGACADSPTTPVQEAPAAEGLLGGLLGGVEVTVLERSQPLAVDEVVTRTIGPSGGTIVLPNAGLTFIVPRNALGSSTSITITAPAGDLMGYHFAPHGLRFNRSALVKQDLTKSELGLLRRLLTRPTAAYFQGELRPIVTALELLPLNLWGLLGFATFDIDHFSGYVIATD